MQFNPASYAPQALAADRNKVLRNTYAMLALTMIPTAIGAVLGINLEFRMSGWVGMLVFFGVAFGSFYAIEKTKNSPLGVFLLLAFTGFMGFWLSQILQVALSFSNGAQLIGTAAVGTAAIFFTLAAIATVTKKDFSFLGKFLFIGLVMVILAAIANVFFAIPALSLAISAACVLIFSLYILYDVSNIVNGGETNYVSATLGLYLNIYNLFTSLLHLLMAFTGERD
ncbi:Bax inhibitor-1/YccA family protein [Chitinilyticum litopenaei]|uniref:Bax inhibitor-1/YccA family protein n=1 Tax=Chitinilyticum litopenaei TaxID=1121276 RepID=UPI000412EC4F|nr:Bax inhibitor-1/YccA family protein [Chitinilyticum litopenaei]